ncbi:hypothetical protein PG991_008071 [Apiospora marii]|uniref:F-box domain-containing protein n=1 Tax=Apiospora marii TaxID=335849 RepID=A0ABR1RV94_9PEZI
MSSQAGPEPAEASHNGQPLTKRIYIPPEIHRMIFNAIDDPKDRARTALSVMLANKELHGLWKRFLYEDNINHGQSSALVHAVLHGFQQPMRDIVGIGTTTEGMCANVDAYIEDFQDRVWCFWPATGGSYFPKDGRLTLLHAAVALNNEETVRFLLQNGADTDEAAYVKEYDVDPNTEYNSERDRESDVWDWHSSTWQSAIHIATCHGHLPIVQLLVDAGSTLLWDPTETEGFNVLHTAAMCGHVHLIRYFVESGLVLIDEKAPYFTQNHCYRFPMMLTAAQCAAHTKAGVRTLWLFRELEANMDLVVLALLQFPSNTTMAHQLLTEASWKVDLEANVTEPDVGECSLADAIPELYLSLGNEPVDLRGWRLVLQAAFAGGADVSRSYRPSLGLPEKPLLEICSRGVSGENGLVLMELLLQKGALNHTPHHHHSMEDYGSSLLLQYLTKITIDRYDYDREVWCWEPVSDQDLWRIQETGYSEDTTDVAEQKVKAILAAGIRAEGVNDYGWTSLIVACNLVTYYKFPLECMEALLESGVDPNETNQVTSPLSNGKKRSPMAVCFCNKHSYKACKLLQSYGGVLHKEDDLEMIECRIEKLVPSYNGSQSGVMKLFKEIASQVEEDK